MPDVTRRSFLLGGCALVGAAATVGLSTDAHASVLTPSVAPRRSCPHDGCRYYRPADGGTCALSLHGAVLQYPEIP